MFYALTDIYFSGMRSSTGKPNNYSSFLLGAFPFLFENDLYRHLSDRCPGSVWSVQMNTILVEECLHECTKCLRLAFSTNYFRRKNNFFGHVQSIVMKCIYIQNSKPIPFNIT